MESTISLSSRLHQLQLQQFPRYSTYYYQFRTISTSKENPTRRFLSSITILRKFLFPLGFFTTTAFFLTSYHYYFNNNNNSFQDNNASSSSSSKPPSIESSSPKTTTSDDKDIIVVLHEDENHAAVSGHNQHYRKPFRIHIYRLFPWRTLSRTTGWLLSLHLPSWTTNLLLSWFVNKYHINLHEAKRDKVSDYKSLADLFSRELKPEARPINYISPLVSPCDGKILQFTRIHKDKATAAAAILPQVKGIFYNIQTFLGLSSNRHHHHFSLNAEHERKKLLTALTSKSSSLYCCIIYLAPGDYHRFHSPCNWQVDFRRHFPGELLSVKPSLTKWIPDIFTLNERVIYIGKWNYGFFSLSAVGATNVGSINIYNDKEVVTNTRRFRKKSFLPIDKWFRNLSNSNSENTETESTKVGNSTSTSTAASTTTTTDEEDDDDDDDETEDDIKRTFKKGEPFGQFNLGSTIVLIFQAPKTFEKFFKAKVGKHVKYGETLI